MSQDEPQDNPKAVSPAAMSGGLGAYEARQSREDHSAAPLLILFQDKRRRREDLRLLLQALNNGWDPENKEAIMQAVHELIHEPDIKPRFLIRCIWAMLKMNQADQNTASIVFQERIEKPRSLTRWQRELRDLLNAKPHLRSYARQEWMKAQVASMNLSKRGRNP